VNTLNSTTITVNKDFSDDSTDSVAVALDCGAGVTVTAQGGDDMASESDPVEFTVEGFVTETRCDASETEPDGYTKDETDCQDIDPNAPDALDRECTIVNTKDRNGGGGGGGDPEPSSTTIVVKKDFQPDNPSAEVAVSLDCGPGVTVTAQGGDNTASESDPVEFTVDGFAASTRCDASEGLAPLGYTKDESDCQDVDPNDPDAADRECTIVNTLLPRTPDAPQPPVIDTQGNCLTRPVLAFVRGERIKKVVFFLDNKRIGADKRADRQGRFTTRIDRRKLSAGKHRLSALVRFFGTKRTYRLGVKIKRCIDKTAPKKIKTTKGAARACPASPFLAYVKGGTISSVEFRLNGELLEKVTVADWKKRYGVLIDPASLEAGENEITALVKFISSSKTEPRELTRRLPSCETNGAG
jgi:hypothetical protein